MYMILTGGLHPFEELDFQNERDKAFADNTPIPDITQRGFAPWPDMQDVIKRCMHQVPDYRPRSADLCHQLSMAELFCLREVLPVSVNTTVECMAYEEYGHKNQNVRLWVASGDNECMQLTWLSLNECPDEDQSALRRRHKSNDHSVRVALCPLLHGAFCLRLYRACPQAFFDMWVEMENVEENYDSLSDLLMREQMVENASPDMKAFLRQWKPKTAEEMVTLADNFLDAHKPRGPFKPSASAHAAGAQHAKAKVASPEDKLKIPEVDTTGLGNKASLEKERSRQKRYYDKNARNRKFVIGDKVLVLLPTSTNKLLAQWQDLTKKTKPNTVVWTRECEEAFVALKNALVNKPVKDTNRKLLRWSLELQEFDYEVKYVRGEANVLADALSRLN
nr:hypothetical protein BaRGS_019822 [Batillaria attramentaria]